MSANITIHNQCLVYAIKWHLIYVFFCEDMALKALLNKKTLSFKGLSLKNNLPASLTAYWIASVTG